MKHAANTGGGCVDRQVKLHNTMSEPSSSPKDKSKHSWDTALAEDKPKDYRDRQQSHGHSFTLNDEWAKGFLLFNEKSNLSVGLFNDENLA